MTVADEKGWPWSAATGAGFAVLMLAGLTLPWIPPPGDASIDTIRSFFVDHRGAILAGDCLFGLGAALFLWFLGTLSSYLRAAESGDDQLSTTAVGGGLVGIGLILASAAGLNGIAFKVGSKADPVLLRALFDLDNALLVLSGFPMAVFVAAVVCCGTRSGALGPWLCWAGGVVALLQIVTGAALFAEGGFFQAASPLHAIALASAILWTFALSVAIVRAGGIPSPSLQRS